MERIEAVKYFPSKDVYSVVVNNKKTNLTLKDFEIEEKNCFFSFLYFFKFDEKRLCFVNEKENVTISFLDDGGNSIKFNIEEKVSFFSKIVNVETLKIFFEKIKNRFVEEKVEEKIPSIILEIVGEKNIKTFSKEGENVFNVIGKNNKKAVFVLTEENTKIKSISNV